MSTFLFTKFVVALAMTESGGNQFAVGQAGEIGMLQISHACVVDVNDRWGTRYVWPDDAFDPAKSRKICELYIRHWGGDAVTYEKAARIWNGGPSGHLKSSTIKYWQKLKTRL